MKIRFFTSVVALIILVVTLASCGSTRSYPEERYPQRYPYPDSRYPDRYPDSRYPDYGTRYPRNLPPGHAKKIYGGRSARPYAHGQQKKYDRRYENQRRYEEQRRIEAQAEQQKKDYYMDKILKKRKKG